MIYAVFAGFGALLTLLRVIALSRIGAMMGETQTWKYDFGPRYGWLICGPILLIFVAYREGLSTELLGLAAVWALGLAAIWLLPDLLKPYL